MNLRSRKIIHTTVLSAMFLALALVLPFLTGQIKEMGNMLLPMHLPVLLCGFICGPVWGLAVGFFAPLLRFAMFGMPMIMPTGIAMAFELAAYGAVSGLLYRVLPQKLPYTYASLLVAMLLGRIVWGAVSLSLNLVSGTDFPFSAFVAGAFLNAFPGMLIQIIAIPPLVRLSERLIRL